MNKLKEYVLPTLVVFGFIVYVGVALHYLGKLTVEVKQTIYENLGVPLNE